MNLSDLIATASEVPKRAGQAASTPNDGSTGENPGAFFELAQDLSKQSEELFALQILESELAVAAEPAADGATLEIKDLDQGAEAIDESIEEVVPEIGSTAAPEQSTLLPSGRPDSPQQEAKAKSTTDVIGPVSAVSNEDQANSDTVAKISPETPPAGHRHVLDQLPTGLQNNGTTENSQHRLIYDVAPITKTFLKTPTPLEDAPVLQRPSLLEDETRPNTPSKIRSGTAVVDSSVVFAEAEAKTPRASETLRTPVSLSESQQTSNFTATEPRLLHFLNAHGALQPAGTEASFVNTPQSTGATVSPLPAAGFAAGALTSEMSSQAIQRNILPQIVGSIQTLQNGGVIDLMLDPPELGRIEILIELSDKNLRATLSADRSGTSDMIRRHAEDLMQQFADAGFGNIDLNFADQRQSSKDSDDPWVPTNQSSEAGPAKETANGLISINTHGRVDLRL